MVLRLLTICRRLPYSTFTRIANIAPLSPLYLSVYINPLFPPFTLPLPFNITIALASWMGQWIAKWKAAVKLIRSGRFLWLSLQEHWIQRHACVGRIFRENLEWLNEVVILAYVHTGVHFVCLWGLVSFISTLIGHEPGKYPSREVHRKRHLKIRIVTWHMVENI